MDATAERPPRGWKRIPRWIRALVVLGLLSVLLWPAYAMRRESALAANERAASAALKELASAQADFRGNDRDGNRLQDFWTGDVAGLCTLKAGGRPLALIDPGIAAADAAPLVPGIAKPMPWRGYYFVAMRLDDQGLPYRQDTQGAGTKGAKDRNHAKFAFSAYPAVYGSSGRHTFNVNEGNTIFKEDLQGKPRTVWPRDEELRLEYTVIE